MGASGYVNIGNILFTVNYLDSCQSEGFRFKADSAFVFTETGNNLESLSHLVIDGKTFLVPVSAQDLVLSVSELLVRNVSACRFSKSESTSAKVALPIGVSFLTLRNARTGKILGREKAIRLSGD